MLCENNLSVQARNHVFVLSMWIKMASWILYSVLQDCLIPALMIFFMRMPVSDHLLNSVNSEVGVLDLY